MFSQFAGSHRSGSTFTHLHSSLPRTGLLLSQLSSKEIGALATIIMKPNDTSWHKPRVPRRSILELLNMSDYLSMYIFSSGMVKSFIGDVTFELSVYQGQGVQNNKVNEVNIDLD